MGCICDNPGVNFLSTLRESIVMRLLSPNAFHVIIK